MKDIDMAIVCFINAHNEQVAYHYEKYQLLHGVKYRKDMSEENLDLIRRTYMGNCSEAAYELKSYYAENILLSNTIVLKMRPETPEAQELVNIRIHSKLDGTDHEYTHHAIEIYKENGRYKVLDVLHRNDSVWLEAYLDEVCETNNCTRGRLRYDLGYLAPCHAFADNMQELTALMIYLDKIYKIGKPRLNTMHIPGGGDEGMILSDDMVMDFDLFARKFGVTAKEVINRWRLVYDKLTSVQFNLLHIMCQANRIRKPYMKIKIAESIFDDGHICAMLDMM